MGSKICMNEVCRSTTSSEWRKGWPLKSGGFAILCHSCGSMFENLVFCDTFHLEESGWRECRICRKRIHCGCIASQFLYDYMDFGGVSCINCVKRLEAQTIRPVQVPAEHIANGSLASNGIANIQPFDNARLMQLSEAINGNEAGDLFKSQKNDVDILRQLKQEQPILPKGELSACFPNVNQQPNGSPSFKKPDKNRPKQGAKDAYEPVAPPSLEFSLSSSLAASGSAQSFTCGGEGKDQNKISAFQQGQRTRHILPKVPKTAPSTSSEANKGTPSQARVARPPVEGRGRNQLLPRYWPRITDQELQQLSGELNSTITPLFEKVLSASDAGRIGRLVLPKACAEAYFPPINQSEGVPIRMADIKGKEWTFQFRFWPNNNSRMYVLEGVTPCIQNMQLQAGDTVIFGRLDPGGKLIMGCRKATNNDAQDPQTNTPNGGSPGEVGNGSRSGDDNVPREKKKARVIGSKNKRLLIHSEDAMELRITWEEAQELFRPAPSAMPTVVMIEGHEFEEYDEPPIFGKKTIFIAGPSGEQEQWAQCDSCSKWRRLPLQVLLPARWSCSDNNWDPSRSSCSALEDINQKELDALLRVNKEFKRRRVTEKASEDCEPSGLDALATAAVLGDNMGESGGSSVGATTRHPRHRPGCSCIVCIQPPSGKGKHPPLCKCNVCLTVKRRFKTLMLRKKKRQSESEAENQDPSKKDLEIDMAAGQALLQINNTDNDRIVDENQMEVGEANKGQLDLNFHPSQDELLAVAAGMSMTNLVNATNLPLEMYLKQTGFGSLVPCSLQQAAGDSDQGPTPDEGCNTSTDAEMEKKVEDGAN